MAYNIKTKNGMAFNLDDPFQEKMYEHICKVPNVSGYLKRLVGMDMMGRATLPCGIQEEEVEIAEVNNDMMLNLI
jgi:hypothetical protein